jgi:hypothetical protein
MLHSTTAGVNLSQPPSLPLLHQAGRIAGLGAERGCGSNAPGRGRRHCARPGTGGGGGAPRLERSWPWAEALVAAFERIGALPGPVPP